MQLEQQALIQAQEDAAQLADSDGPSPHQYVLLSTNRSDHFANIDQLRKPAPAHWGIKLKDSRYTRFFDHQINPQHTPDGISATEIALDENTETPPAGTLFAVMRPRSDYITALAVWLLKTQERPILDARAEPLVNAIRKAHEPWQPLAPDHVFQADDADSVLRMVSDNHLTLEQRVRLAAEWLSNDIYDLPLYYQLEQDRQETLQSLIAEGGLAILNQDGVASVVSNHALATESALYLAPIVVTTNPSFYTPGIKPYRKHTVTIYQRGYLDLKSVRQALNIQEPGWGGGLTIIGSPQGKNSILTHQDVSKLVRQHLVQHLQTFRKNKKAKP